MSSLTNQMVSMRRLQRIPFDSYLGDITIGRYHNRYTAVPSVRRPSVCSPPGRDYSAWLPTYSEMVMLTLKLLKGDPSELNENDSS
eukprot:COSAG01_NODE_22412_length_857_cov_0.984169_2_plen_86_part_00